MALTSGTKLGPYEVASPLGSGGMGEVYRARDSRLNRAVAIKVLRSDFSQDRERLLRFEREARAAAALNHSNIVAIYDIGTQDGSPYIVSELLEGASLRSKLVAGTLSRRDALRCASQIAQGLTAAHAKGIVHRDLKPENIFVTKDGTAKILDFGIAKLTQLDTSGDAAETSHSSNQVTLETNAGLVLGTVGYMSPEQIRNGPVDHRSDIFSFGAILFEMFTGKQAFTGRTTFDTVSSILRDEPTESSDTQGTIPTGIQSIVRHCLEKDPEKRYQSTHDMAFALEEMSGLQSETAAIARPVIAGGKRRAWLWIVAGIALAAAVTMAILLGFPGKTPPPLSFQRLTFLRGTVWSARFAPDGRTVIYGASWNGGPMNIFATQPEALGSRSMGLANDQILAISSSGEMAILVKRSYLRHHLSTGTLAKVSSVGGTPREILDDVQEADWAPNGTDLAVVRGEAGQNRLEFPAGKLVYQPEGWISYPRVSPRGDKIAFMEHPVQGDSRGWVSVIDMQGKKTRLTGEWAGEEGLAWSPDGKEVWFTANNSGGANSLYAVTPSGGLRTIASAPVNLILCDVSHDRKVLLSSGNESSEFEAFDPGAKKEHDVSWLDWGAIRDLSSDGQTLIFTHFGERSGKNYSVYLRQLDSPTAVRLGDGSGWALSPDGKEVIAILADPPGIVLLPTGAGNTQHLPTAGIEEFGLGAGWFPDGKKIVFVGRAHDRQLRSYAEDVASGLPQPITPEDVTGTLLSPDGKYLVATDSRNYALWPVGGGPPHPIAGLSPQDRIIRFNGNGRSLFVFESNDSSGKIYQLDLSTGRRELWKELSPADPAGIREFKTVLLTPDGKYYVYGLTRSITSLYLTHVAK